MRKMFLIMILSMLVPVMSAAAQTPLEKPGLDRPALQNPAAEKIGKQLRPWLAMEINDFRTLWNGRPIYTYTLTNNSREQSGQLEVTTSFADGPNGPWNNTDVLGFMSLPPGASQGPVIQTFPRGTRWIKVEIRQDLKPGKPVVLAKKFEARYAGPAINSVTRKVAADKTGAKLVVAIENPTVEKFNDDCSIQWSFSDSPKGMHPAILHKEPLVIPASATITHDLPITKDASKPYLTVTIKGLYDTIAVKRFKQVGRTFKPIK
jgi:hypothetical protein